MIPFSNLKATFRSSGETMNVVIGSKNPTKVDAVQSAFSRSFPDQLFSYNPISVSSGVSDQPMSDEETLNGAVNRAKSCKELHPDFDFFVGLEGGCSFMGNDLYAFAWMVVMRDNEISKAKTSTFLLPPEVASLVSGGMELGHADDKVFGRTNSKEKDGAVGILTKGLINRAEYYEQALIMALIPFINPELYSHK